VHKQGLHDRTSWADKWITCRKKKLHLTVYPRLLARSENYSHNWLWTQFYENCNNWAVNHCINCIKYWSLLIEQHFRILVQLVPLYQSTRVRSHDCNLNWIYYRSLVFPVFDLSDIHQHLLLLLNLLQTHFELLGHLQCLPVPAEHIGATADAHVYVIAVAWARVTRFDT
jgi:hypothetical protein